MIRPPDIRTVVHFAVECVAGAFTLFVAKEDMEETLLSEEEEVRERTCWSSLETPRRDIWFPLPVGHSI
jgi:hypothetical protein